MRTVIALAIIAAGLAGCNKGAANLQNAASTTGLPVPGPRPNASASSDSSFRARFREVNIGTCIAGAEANTARGRGAPPGSDIRGYCTCFIDGAIAGIPDERLARLQPGPREQAIAQQCASERGMSTDFSRAGSQ